MAAPTTLAFSLLTLSLLYLSTPTTSAAAATATSPAASFVRNSCKATSYPALCFKSLSTYAAAINKNPAQLVVAALTVSVDTAEQTKSFVEKLTRFKGLKPRETAAVKDCYEEISDSVDRLSKSAKELKNMGRAKGPEFIWHMSNLQTWVSAAMTDDSTCSDGFAGRALNGRIKNSIRARMTNLAHVTSNALALCNKYAEKH